MTPSTLQQIKDRAEKARVAGCADGNVCGVCGHDFDLRFQSESTGYCDECAQAEAATIPALIDEVERLRELLKETHAAWLYDANQGDGIMEEYANLSARVKQEFNE